MLSEAVNVKVTLPREKQKEMRVLTKDEQATFEKHLSLDMNTSKLGVLLCLYTGLRIGEAYVKLKLKNNRKYFLNIDFQNRTCKKTECGFAFTA